MENLMIKAIKQFKKNFKNAEIRACSVSECVGGVNKRYSALFYVEYIEYLDDDLLNGAVHIEVCKED